MFFLKILLDTLVQRLSWQLGHESGCQGGLRPVLGGWFKHEGGGNHIRNEYTGRGRVLWPETQYLKDEKRSQGCGGGEADVVGRRQEHVVCSTAP